MSKRQEIVIDLDHIQDDPEVLATLILGSTVGINLQASIDGTVDTNAAAELMADIILSYISLK